MLEHSRRNPSPFGWFDAVLLLPGPLLVAYLIVRTITEAVAG